MPHSPSSALVYEYQQFMQHSGLSPHSLRAYQQDLSVLLQCAGDTPLQNLTRDDLRGFVRLLHEQSGHAKSLARRIAGWRRFYHFLKQYHGLQDDPSENLRAPKSVRALPQALSVEQAIRLVSVSGDDVLAMRDAALLELFYSSGLRLNEVQGLDVAMLDFQEGTVRVLGKGRKERVVPMGSHAISAMQNWLKQRATLKLQLGHEQAVFVSKQGRRLDPRSLRYCVERRAQQQGISSRVHPHVLRHTFASHVLQSSQNLRAVQEMLGHSSIRTTQIYTHLDFQHLAQVYHGAHPRAKKKKTS